MGLFEQFPYTNYDRLNLDSLIKTLRNLKTEIESLSDLPDQMAEIQEKLQEVQDLYNSFEYQITNKFEDLANENEQTFNTLKAGIEADFQILQTQVERQIETLEEDVERMDIRINNILNNLPSEVFMTSPFTGEQTSLENVIFELANAQRTESISAEEYDALNLTSSTYDAKQLTAFNYDWHAKELLQ